MNVNNVQFIKSAAKPKDFISSDLPSIVFSGKSNVGKSSVINRLLNRKNFARVSSEPGKTAHINYFLIDDKAYFVDLPGYGYAKVSMQEKERWAGLMESFFQDVSNITLGVMIVDLRHKPTADDILMSDCFKATGHPFIVVANKCDKLKKGEIEPNSQLIRDTLTLPDDVPVIVFSAEKGTGMTELMSNILKYV